MTKKQDICKANIEEFDNSDNYNETHVFEGMQKVLEEDIQEVISSFKRDNLKIIDIACGTGVLTKIIFNKTKKSKIYCLDISKRMLSHLKERLSKEELKRSKFICSDAFDYFIKSKEKFDLITVHGSLHHFFDYLDVIDIASKKLKPHGIFFIAGEPLPREKYNYYIDQTLRLWDRAFKEYKHNKFKQIAYILYAPFNFISPIVNHKSIKSFKDKILHGTNIDQDKAQLVEYWGYERGLDVDKIKEIFAKNKLSILKFSGSPHFKINLFNKIENLLHNSSCFMLSAVKK